MPPETILRVVLPGDSAARAVELGGDPVTIGRGLANVVILRSDARTSLRHASIERTPEGYVLRDEGSTNGTWVNNKRVSRCVLRHRDEIRVGDTLITFDDPTVPR